MKTQDFLLRDFKNLLHENKPLIGIDYGMKRIGIAVSDTRWVLASPLKIIHKINELDDIVSSRSATGFIIGMPYEPGGNEGKMAIQVRLFANRLSEKYNLPIYFTDERHSSVEATEKLINDLKMTHKKAKEYIDSHAAALILQNILDRMQKV
ncbi:MAG: Holliday junction resolvase RuvX [Lactobacillales bacterium]|jgi:putative Holliday junction resolvase|nr:Holliday junction resolvase RuvX [Lactobacillales bacterium]